MKLWNGPTQSLLRRTSVNEIEAEISTYRIGFAQVAPDGGTKMAEKKGIANASYVSSCSRMIFSSINPISSLKNNQWQP